MRKLLCLFVLSILVLSCKRDEPSDLQSYTNNWILANMEYHYYWNDKIPSRPDKTLKPKAFFQSLLYHYKQADGDRFSWIQPDYTELMKMLKGVTPMDPGFEYRPFIATEKGKVHFLVLYTKKGSDAEKKGLKRGDVIYAIDGKAISMDNYDTILKNKNSLNLEIHNKEAKVQINCMPNFAENPIFSSETLQPANSNKKIAYLTYMFFSSDSGDETESYDLALIKEFEKFASEGVDEFVLDLRYNPGGSLQSCLLLSSLLNKDRQESEIFAKLKTNKKINEKAEYKFLEKYKEKELPKLEKISRIFVLTGKGTASSSEMVINGLKPHKEIILIGDTTVGKNVGSYTLYDRTNKANKWGIQPITFKIFNGQGESNYSAGFPPDYPINEFEHPMVDFGDFNDPLLNRALKVMGITVPSTSRQKREIAPSNPILGKPLHKRVSRENWQESEMDYPMYIDNDF